MKCCADLRNFVGLGRQECLPHRCITWRICAALFAAVLAAGAVAEDAVAVAELSPAAELAIEKGLHFLANTQNPDGSWGTQYPMADTSASLMAFMLKGNFPKRGKYGAVLEKATIYLIKRGVESKGFLGGQAQGMYEHGLGTLALSEVWGESDHRKEIRDVLKMAVDVTLRAQNAEGGWRYGPQPNDADISVTVMQVVALTSAKEAGILVPDQTLQKAVQYVKRCQNPNGGGFAYQPGGAPGFARSAAGIMSLMMSGQKGSQSVARGLEYLVKYNESKFREIEYYNYAHYYAVQCMYQAGDALYQPWYSRIREALLSRAKPDGSWPAGNSGGSTQLSTALSILVLGVPYRFLPIYQR